MDLGSIGVWSGPLQVVTDTPAAIPMDGFRQLAKVLPH
jgi:hypothetical protein